MIFASPAPNIKGPEMRTATTVLVLAAIGFIGADDPKKDAKPTLKGNWTAVSLKAGGQEAPADEAKKMKFGFEDATYTNSSGDDYMEEGAYTTDTSKTPNTIDFDIKKGPDAGKKQLGIFKIEGDTATLVVALAGSTERPKSFKPDDSENMIVAVIERVKN
jgi:uncharacterized protein (TIGR03067 family)